MRASHSRQAHITPAWCTKSSLNPPNKRRPGDPLTGRFCFWRSGLTPPGFELLANYNDDEGARLHFAAALTGSGRIKVRGRKKDVVCFQVEAHGAGAAFGGDIFDNGELVRRIFVDDREVAIAAGGERIAGRGIEPSGIRTFADGGRGDNFAGIGVHNGHDFFIADGEEAAIGNVDGEAGRRFARRERPVVEFLEALRVNVIQVGSILVVDIDAALAVSSGEFGLAIERDRASYRAISGVDGGGVLAAAVEGEDTLGDGFIEDGIGIGVGLDRADGFESFEIENSDGVGAAVTGEAAAKVGSDGDAMRRAALST